MPLPTVLIGRWETSAPTYAGRFFEITEAGLVIGTGAGNTERSTILTVRQAVDEIGVLYAIEYVDPVGERNTMAFYFDGDAGGKIRLKNQRHMVWEKVRR